MSERGGYPGSETAPIGILAGSGTLPAEVARSIIAGGGRVHIVRIGPDEDGALAGFPVDTFGWGQMGGIFSSFRRAGCRELVFVGSVRRPDLTTLRPDLGLFYHLPGLLGLVVAGGDDGLARTSIRFVETRGFKVASIADVAPGLLVPAGALGVDTPDADDMADILLGSSVVRALGRHDIGQGVVVSEGGIEAIEGAEGTDRMLERVARQRGATGFVERGRRRGVLVKRPKPGQEMRIDIPAIGPRTIDRAEAAGLSGIAVLAGATLAADRPALIRRAAVARMFVYGFTEGDMPPAATRVIAAPQYELERLDQGSRAGRSLSVAGLFGFSPLARGTRALGGSDASDARRGAGALASLAALGRSGAVVVVNGYSIGIEPSADIGGLIERTAHIRPWGVGRWRRRAGVVVVSRAADVGDDVIARAGAARLSAVAICDASGGDQRIARLAETAAAARLSVVGVRAIDEGGGGV